CCLFSFVIFFFQAEDGIRDATVTGVQTCALPIYRVVLQIHEAELGCTQLRFDLRAQVARLVSGFLGRLLEEGFRLREHVGEILRSEERRVGKEGRSGRWAYE